ncbi:hypothetical protein EDC96DRAFT_563467 [Choanephora cucurbitarum]|nr:hypothetical protein EDC96DRAFT_563467 [Choanephora cucurbitarum]
MLLILFVCVGPHAKDQYVAIPNEWVDFTRSDFAYKPVKCSSDLLRILIEILNKQYKVIVIDSIIRNLLETEIPGSHIPFAKQLSSIGRASSCLLFNAETIVPYLNKTPLNPLLALVHCLIEQEASLANFAQSNDPTSICLSIILDRTIRLNTKSLLKQWLKESSTLFKRVRIFTLVLTYNSKNKDTIEVV